MFTATGTLQPVPPFDFSQSLGFLGMFNPMHGEQTLAPGTLTKAVWVDEQTIVFEVRAVGTNAAPQLAYTLHAAQPISAAIHATAAQRIAFFLSTADDLRPFYAIGADDPAFAPIIEQLHGYHQLKFFSPFECACWAVLTQRNQMANARNMKRALMDHFEGSIEFGGARYDVFPDAAQIAAVSIETLTTLIRHAQKAQYLYAVADAFAHVDEAWLHAGSYDEVSAWLRGITGIGAWSAAFILLRGLGHMERLPSSEEAFARAVANVYNGGVPLPSNDVQRLATRYGAYQGYWAHYLRVAG